MALQLNKPAEKQLLDAYHEALADETEPFEWNAFARVAVKRFGWKFIPTVPEILDALREYRGQPSLEGEAIRAYERVLDSGEYVSESGTQWTFRRVKEMCGRAAAEAFLEAGGHNAFAWGGRDEPKRRERFIAAYQQTARDMPDGRLLQAAPMNLLAPMEHAAPTTAEAEHVITALRERIGELVKHPSAPRGLVVKDDGRAAELIRQAAAMGVTPELMRAAREASDQSCVLVEPSEADKEAVRELLGQAEEAMKP